MTHLFASLIVPRAIAQEMERICQEASPDVRAKSPEFDREAVFKDGTRMAIQVCPGGEGEPCWTQGVLYSERGDEIACTEPQDSLSRTYTVPDGFYTYTCMVVAADEPSADEIERMEQIAQDTKKGFRYGKHDGTWAWFDRDEEDNVDAWHTGFPTRLAALADATEPYLNPED